MDQLEEILHKAGSRLTEPRRQVFMILEGASQPLSLRQISSRVEGVNRASIYRTLEIFNSLNIIEIVYVGWKKRYELASPFQPHHHHLQCVQCQELISLSTPELETVISQLASAHGYRLISHHIELRGLCMNCRTE